MREKSIVGYQESIFSKFSNALSFYRKVPFPVLVFCYLTRLSLFLSWVWFHDVLFKEIFDTDPSSEARGAVLTILNNKVGRNTMPVSRDEGMWWVNFTRYEPLVFGSQHTRGQSSSETELPIHHGLLSSRSLSTSASQIIENEEQWNRKFKIRKKNVW